MQQADWLTRKFAREFALGKANFTTPTRSARHPGKLRMLPAIKKNMSLRLGTAGGVLAIKLSRTVPYFAKLPASRGGSSI